MHRSFNKYAEALRSAEAFAGAGFAVSMFAATGRFLMRFDPKGKRAAMGGDAGNPEFSGAF